MKAYNFVHKHFVKKTVHAGEAYGPQSIFQAITKLHADRLGHGTRMYEVDQVQNEEDPDRFIRQLRVNTSRTAALRLKCVTSNLQTNPRKFVRWQTHPVGLP